MLITLFQSVSKVIGIEYNRQAVEDAKVNAGLNGKCFKVYESKLFSIKKKIYFFFF